MSIILLIRRDYKRIHITFSADTSLMYICLITSFKSNSGSITCYQTKTGEEIFYLLKLLHDGVEKTDNDRLLPKECTDKNHSSIAGARAQLWGAQVYHVASGFCYL